MRLLAAALVLLLTPAVPAAPRYTRSVATCTPPAVTLIDARGEQVPLASALDSPGPVVLQFIFTTCPSICPLLSSTLSAAQGARKVSISIDPEFDTPARLREYAGRFKAGPDWWFLTGSREDVAAVQKAFGAYRGNKMSHEPLTFLRTAPGEPWLRFAGPMTGAELASELRKAGAGRRIYREACASCHKRSGFGTSEGGVYIPRVTGPALFQSGQIRRADLFRNLYQEVQPQPYGARLRDPRPRPAYTPETLAAAVREGRDPAGRTLDPLMPRLTLSDEEMAHLTAYLQGLSAAPSPGVDGEAIHFATVVTEGVDPGRRKAMLDVMAAYVRWKNAETRHSAARLGFSPWYRDEFAGSYREWKLHVWELRGAAATWPAQLAAYYRAQPVFVLLSGIGVGEWRPVHDFCERQEVPCLFPNTDLPVVSPPGAYALYLSPGLTVEAEALARRLGEDEGLQGLQGQQRRQRDRDLQSLQSLRSLQSLPVPMPGRVVQVYREAGRVPAQALRNALPSVTERAVPSGEALTPAFWQRLVRETRPDVLVLWLGPEDAASLGPAEDAFAGVRQLVFSYSLLEEAEPAIPAGLRRKAWLTWPFALPGQDEPLAYRVRAWMRARRVEPAHERLQLDTWFALAVTDHSLVHLVESFSRDFFVESVEEETENALSPGVFPSLSLSPGQRFASKGSYVVRLADGATGVEAVGGWIVP
ncbi:MAG TPA: SCO family protein [Thermoanaerobaculia bacterium]|nr:SCO family protein [Thermoanaerobaculia bacterium]